MLKFSSILKVFLTIALINIINVMPTTAKDNGFPLIAHYTFDGNILDQSKNEFHGKNNGGVFCPDQKGRDNSAIRVDGIDDFIRIPVNINPTNHTEVTICAWIKPESINNQSTIFSCDDGGYDRSIVIDSRGYQDGDFEWGAFCGDEAVLGSKAAKQGEWYFIAVRYNQKKERIILTVNTSNFYKDGKLGEGHEFCHIGSNPSHGEFLNGDIDDVRIYSKSLSNKELKSVMKNYK